MLCDYTRIKSKFVLSRVNLRDVSQLLTATIAKSIRLLAAQRARATCAGCATIRRLMKCPGRVILRRHNGVSSGSSRIISLGCVRAANNSLLFPASGINASLMMTRRRRSRRIAKTFARSFRTVRQLPRQASVDADASACRRDRAGLPTNTRDRSRRSRVPVVVRDRHRIFYAEIVKRVQSWCVWYYAMHMIIDHSFRTF